MKNLVLSFLFLASALTASFANNASPESELSVLSTAKVEMNVMNVAQKDFFQVAQYNDKLETLDFVTKDKINYIQVFSTDGKLQYQLPVMSNKLKISMKMFDEGTYKLGFITKNNTTIQFTNLKVN